MKVFALECSTVQAGAAMLENGRVVASISWREERARHESLFDRADVMVRGAGWRWTDFDLFCVGRGPGAYSGLRVSLLAVQALAAPGGKPVMAVGSMDALAVALCRKHGVSSVTIAGDARRNSCWIGRCQAASIAQTPTEWRVVGRDQLTGFIRPGETAATPHWEELTAIRELNPEATWLPGPAIPTAEQVALLAVHRFTINTDTSEPLQPLYMHPAV
ncbi:MAG TPA: tRNA (adenosine(37)-N6)-threonylcarbamoyltransferase complex dimerization subunit type 1 TsaB [Kiritimatiellia bacterium]|nr:tRNA (adenosine(37)-N6)-threonylcarbamoyltransferase complex dimerization subunit type 1 TsaB [Kiritimatiellia bacterium]